MSAIKFKVGEPKTLTLSFDEPKIGTNDFGRWYMYGFKNGDISSEEDCFFATETLHTMIQTLGAKEGDQVDIEKCQEGDVLFYKVNGLTIRDMNNGGSAGKIEAAKPNPPKASLEVDSGKHMIDLGVSIEEALEDYSKLKEAFSLLEDKFKELHGKIELKVEFEEDKKDEGEFNVNDIPF